MRGEDARSLPEDQFLKLAKKKLTKKQLDFLEKWKESFDVLPLNVQMCMAGYILSDFLGLEVAEDEDEPTLPANGGMMYG